MIRFPYRQVFGDTSVGGVPTGFDAVFRPKLGFALTDLVETFAKAVKP